MSVTTDAAGQPAPSPLLAAGRVLAERGVYALVWLDDDLMVTARYGRLAEFMEVGEPLVEQCLPLYGLEDDIRALKGAQGRVLDLPAVLIATSDDRLPRLNLTVFWHDEGGHYLMLVARATSRSDTDAELSKQMRARLMAEAEVAAKSRELARANRDLEDFAAIISHDLKSPLRALRYATEDLGKLIAVSDKAGVEARLTDIGERTRRMSDMMTQLLDYASVGRKSEIAEETDTRQLVEAVTRSLARPSAMCIEITGQWPRFVTVGAALDLVLRNLVQNAIVHHDRDQGLITVAAEDTPRELVISVSDDGPGIDPAYHAAILLPFRTLKQKPGSTGMGLAFVNRMIEMAGGRLTIASDPAKARGTQFRIVWPKVIMG